MTAWTESEFPQVSNPVTKIWPLSSAGLRTNHHPKPALCGFFFVSKSQQSIST